MLDHRVLELLLNTAECSEPTMQFTAIYLYGSYYHLANYNIHVHNIVC